MAGDSDTELPLELRRNRMAAVISDQRYMRVQELAARFTVSEVTVRSDLAELERHAQVRRVRGGAVSVERPPRERPFEEMLGDRADEKRQIGIAAAQLMTSGETLLLDVGTTTAAVARALVARADLTDVTVVGDGSKIGRVALSPLCAIDELDVLITSASADPQLVEQLRDAGVHVEVVAHRDEVKESPRRGRGTVSPSD